MSVEDKWKSLPEWLKGGSFGVLFGISYAVILEMLPHDLSETFFFPLLPESMFFYVFFEEKGIWFLSIVKFGLLGALYGHVYSQLKMSKDPFWKLNWVTVPSCLMGIWILITSFLLLAFFPNFFTLVFFMFLFYSILYLVYSEIVPKLPLKSYAIFIPFVIIALMRQGWM